MSCFETRRPSWLGSFQRRQYAWRRALGKALQKVNPKRRRHRSGFSREDKAEERPGFHFAHLALSLERLDHLCGRRLQRIGLSATQKSIEEVARFPVGSGSRDACTIVNRGCRRYIDVAIEVPGSPLEAVMAAEVWQEVYHRLKPLRLDDASRKRRAICPLPRKRAARKGKMKHPAATGCFGVDRNAVFSAAMQRALSRAEHEQRSQFSQNFVTGTGSFAPLLSQNISLESTPWLTR